MRYLPLATVIAVSVVAPLWCTGQTLSVTHYQFISSTPVTVTKANVTYRADLVNAGNALTSVTATLTSLNTSSFTIVQGQNTLNFAPVPANSQITSSNTFTILVDRSVPFKPDFSDLSWTFKTTGAPPVANAGVDQTVAVGSTVTLNGSGSTNPSGIGTLTYLWAFTMKPSGSAATLSNTAAVMPTFIADVSGSYMISLTVSNGTDSGSTSVTISTSHSPPVANAGANQTVAVGATAILNGRNSWDPDGNPLTYQWNLLSIPSGSHATLQGATSVTPSFVADKFGTYSVQLVVSDSFASSSASTVTISTSHTPPVANAGANQTANVETTVQLDGSKSTDPDGNPITYSWSFLSLPMGSTAALSDFSASVNPSFKVDALGTYVVQLIVSDAFSTSQPSTTTITTSDILPPTANAGPPQTVPHGTVVTLMGSGTDPQSLPLTFMWSLTNRPQGSAASLSNPNTATPVFTADLPGSYLAQLIVNNGFLSSSASTVMITTTNSPPVANAGSNQSVAVGTTVTLNGNGSFDPDHDPITYSWSILSAPPGSAVTTASLVGANTISPMFVPDVGGVYVAQLVVNDGFTNSLVPSTVMITAGAIVLTPNPINMTTAGTGQLTITLPFNAGSNGQVVNLTANPGVVNIPAMVTIPSGTSALTITITPAGVGSTTITATASAILPGSTNVNVVQASIALTPNPLNVGLTLTANGTITLTPTPTSDTTITLGSSDTTLATVTPSVVIPSGSATGSFTVTGVAPTTGKTAPVITASATGYLSGTTTVGVFNLGKIFLPVNTSVAPGASVPFTVTLSTPAPSPGGTTVTLKSDSGNATITGSVSIPAGATTPITQPTLTGVAIGGANITASAPGFIGDTESVTVQAALSFPPGTLTIFGNNTQNLLLTLSSPAAQTLVINLMSSDTNVATVPATVTIQATGSSVNVPITGQNIKNGSTTITASTTVSGISSAMATVTDIFLGQISLPSGASVALGQSIPFPISSPTTTSSALTVTLNSSDTSTLTVAPPSVTIPINATTPTVQPQVTGVAVGSTNVNATATGYGTSSATVNVTATVSFPPGALTLSGGTTQNLTLTLSATTPKALTINLHSDNTGVATVPATVTIPAGSNSVSVPITGVLGTGGSTLIHANLLPNIPDASVSVTVTILQSIGLQSGVTVTPNASTPIAVSLPAPAPSNVTVTLSSDTPSVAMVTPSVMILAGATTPTSQPTVTGVSFGTANITASASGYTSGMQQVQVTGSLSFPPGTFSVSVNATQNLTLTLSSATPTALVVNLMSSSGAATVPATVTIPANASSVSVPITGVSTGSATITATSNISTVSGATVNVSVINGIILPSNVVVTPTNVSNFPVTLGLPAPSDTFILLTSSDPTKVALSANGAATTAFSILAGHTAPSVTVRVFGVDFGSATITASATGYTPVSQTVQVVSSVVLVPNPVSIIQNGSKFVTLVMATPAPSGITVNLSSDNPNVATVPASVAFPANTTGACQEGVGTTCQVVITVNGGNVNDSTLIHASAPPFIPDTVATVIVGTPPPPFITTTSLAVGQVGVPYSQQLTGDGGIVPFTWSVIGGTLPNGLTLNAKTGLISGTPTQTASTDLTFQITDSATPTPHTGTSTLHLNVLFQGALFVTSTFLPNGIQNTAYSATLTAAGGNGAYTWSLAPGSNPLPNFLMLNPSTGAITGVPTTVISNLSLTFQVTDMSNPVQTATKTLTLTILSPNLVITTTSLPNAILNQPYSATIQATGGIAPYTWSVLSGGLPGNFSLNPTTGVLSSTNGPTCICQGLYLPVIQVADSAGHSTTATLALTVTDNSLQILSTSLPAGQVGVPYSFTPMASGGTPPYTWSFGGLPQDGLVVNTSTGQVTGTPTSPLSTNTKFTVTDSATPTPQSVSSFFHLTINNGPPVITTASLNGGVVGTAYSSPVVAAGGTTPYTFSISGQPAGLTINASTGVITGTPTTVGTNSNVVVTVTDSSTPTVQTATKTFSIIISPVLSITTTSPLPGGTVSTNYSAQVMATGGTGAYTWAISGQPAGLSINASTGVISGTPTAAGTSNNVVVTVTDSGSPMQTATQTFSITIVAGLAITTPSPLPSGAVNVAYSTPITAINGTGTLTWGATGLPANLTINSSTGVIGGTPTVTGTSTNVVVTVTDSASPPHTANKTFTLVITPGLAISTTSPLPTGTVNIAYGGQALQATGGQTPYTWSATGLPPNLSINASSGQITGVPTTAGTSSVMVTVTDSTLPTHLVATGTFSLTIANPLTITTTSPLPAATQGVPYSFTMGLSGGTSPYTWSATSLPAGLGIDPSSGVISGTPTGTLGTSMATITLKDSQQNVASGSFSITVALPPLVIHVGTNGQVSVGQNLQTTVTLSVDAAPQVSIPLTLMVSNLGVAGFPPIGSQQGFQAQLMVTLPANVTSIGVNIVGVAVGQTTVTATGSAGGNNYSGAGTVNVTPSGFKMTGPNSSSSFTINQGQPEILTVTAVQLDSAGNILGTGTLAATLSASVQIMNSSPSCGTIAGPVNFSAGDSIKSGTFTALITGSTAQCTSTLTANPPTGFLAPAANANVVTGNVSGVSCTLPNLTVGRNLAASTFVTLSGQTSGTLQIVIQSTDTSKVQLACSEATQCSGTLPGGSGVSQITLTLPTGETRSAAFLVYGVNAATAGVNYTAACGSFGSDSKVVTVDPSGFVIGGPSGPGGPVNVGIGAATASNVTISSVVLDPNTLNPATDGQGHILFQPLAGGLTDNPMVSLSETDTPPAMNVGSLSPTSVTFTAGQGSATSLFTGANPGKATLAAARPATPAGFSTPSIQYSTAPATVTSSTMNVCGDGSLRGGPAVQVGFQLEVPCAVIVSQPVGADTVVTLSTTSNQLLISTDPTLAGLSNNVTVTIPSGQTSSNLYYLQALSSTATATYTGTAAGLVTATGTVNMTPSAVIISGPSQQFSNFSTTLSGGPVKLSVSLYQLNPGGNPFGTNQALAGGLSLSLTLSDDPNVATVPSPIPISAGALGAQPVFAPQNTGMTTVTVSTPTGFTATQFSSVVATVTPP